MISRPIKSAGADGSTPTAISTILFPARRPPALNPSHYCNQDVDVELDAARIVEARADRLAHYHRVAEHTLVDRPIIYLYDQKWLWALSNKLGGFTPLPDGLIRPQGLRLD